MAWTGKEGLSEGREGVGGLGGARDGKGKESLKQCDKEIIKVRL